MIKDTEASSSGMQLTTDTVLTAYREKKINEIFSITKAIKVENCTLFFDAVKNLVMCDPSSQVTQMACFELLKILTSDRGCLKCYVEGDYYKSLVLTDEDLQDISLSIFIPIFEHHRKSVTSELIQKLDSLIPFKPLKIARLFAIYTDEINEGSTSINLQIIDLLIMRAEIFLKGDAAKTLIHTLYKLTQTFPQFFESRGQYCAKIFIKGLSLSSNDTVITSYQALLGLGIKEVNTPNQILYEHLTDDIKRDYALQFLANSIPENITPELLNLIIDNFEKSRWGEIAFLQICSQCEFQEEGLQFLNKILDGSIIDIQQTIKMLIILLRNENVRNVLPYFDNLYHFFEEILNENSEPVFLELVYNILRHLNIDKSIFLSISSTSLLSKYLSLVIQLDEEHYYLYGYLLIDYLGRIGYSPDYLLMIKPSLNHLNSQTALQCCSLSYYILISNYQEAISSLVDFKIVDAIQSANILIQNKQFAVVAISNIENMVV